MIKNQALDKKKNFRFVDLFAGIGGFHQAIKQIFPKSRCVAVVEKNTFCQKTYHLNYKFDNFYSDVTDKNVQNYLTNPDIEYDLITAGFPCTPFSKAGKMMGKEHPEGELFKSIIKIVEDYNKNHQCPIKFILLENVTYLAKHNKKQTWQEMSEGLKNLGYILKFKEIANPLDLNIPQNRSRLFAWFVHQKFDDNFSWTKKTKRNHYNTNALLFLKNKFKKDIVQQKIIDKEKEEILLAWEEFVKINKLGVKRIGFPFWLDFFGFDYLNDEKFKQSFSNTSHVSYESFQEWKKEFLEKNRGFYKKNKKKCDKWWGKWGNLLKNQRTYCKFEWNGGEKINSIKEGIIQFRNSGIRVKKPNFFPALVKTQSRAIWWDKKIDAYRYLSSKEALVLQSFPKNFYFPKDASENVIINYIGNSLNIKILKSLFKENKELILAKLPGKKPELLVNFLPTTNTIIKEIGI
ncbi:MAG: DNA (cytosine-5-)-methyltransferase [Candidatus Moeniiplasma glomeromycotorum]|nr:DNA (cytosine-5-)-methyltransferase [Candidatus Moeniiplasma glomeromycotorum]MCE8168117.1 DNA (cytosine-5-)-methyltransferase [Candidatus Moeniiplasma glomeromycotorum]